MSVTTINPKVEKEAASTGQKSVTKKAASDSKIDYSQLPPETIIRSGEVERLTTMKRETRRKAIEAGDFPAPRKLGPRINGWSLGEVLDWCRGEWRSNKDSGT